MTTYSDADLHALADTLGERLRDNHDRLVTAESCTGGWIAKTVTDIAGSSDWFDCGIAAYSYEAKQALLGVRPQTLEAQGAVSRETVIEMVSGALVQFGRRHRGGRHRHRRPGRRHRRQAGRHGLDRLEAARRLSQGRSFSTSMATARRCGGRPWRQRCAACSPGGAKRYPGRRVAASHPENPGIASLHPGYGRLLTR